MNFSYPDRHHPVYFLMDALEALGADVTFHRDSETQGCWGLSVNGKLMVWFIDDRWPHERKEQELADLKAHGVLICNAQKPDADRTGGHWLPLAATPGFYPKPMKKLFDVGFVGYMRDEARLSMLSNVASRYTVSFIQGVFGEAALDTYCQSRVALNVPTRYGHPLAYDINMRVLECLATGIPTVTNALDDLGALGIVDGETAITYATPDAVFDAIQNALEHPEVGEAGAALIQERHTYTHRAKQVLEWLG